MTKRLLALSVLVWTTAVGASSSLDNDSILKMVSAGLGEDVMVAVINSQPGSYSVGPDELIKLKADHVPDRVIAAMVGAAGMKSKPAVTLARRASEYAVPEICAYYPESAEWKDLKAEVVNWKTGGVVKHVGSLGVVKGDLNSLIDGAGNPGKLKLPIEIEILIYSAEGIGATEYKLPHFHEYRNSREFWTVTGGVFHVSEGAMRDIVPFDSAKKPLRTCVLKLSSLAPANMAYCRGTASDQTMLPCRWARYIRFGS
jgi:hypothetical protein